MNFCIIRVIARKQSSLLLLLLFSFVFSSSVFASSFIDRLKGIYNYEHHDYDRAIEHLKDQSDDANNSLYLGNSYYRKGEFDKATEEFKKLTSSSHDQEKAYYNLGNSLYRQNQLEDSVKSYEETLKLNPHNEEAQKNLEFVKKKLQEQQKKEEEQKQGKTDEQKKDQQQKSEQQKGEGKQQEPSQVGGQDGQNGQQHGPDGQDEQQKQEQQPGQEQPQQQDQLSQSDGKKSSWGDRLLEQLPDNPQRGLQQTIDRNQKRAPLIRGKEW